MLDRFLRRIHEKAADPWAAPVLIVAFGDSVTQGMTVRDDLLHEAVFHARFKRLLEQRYPRTTFSVINAGVGGLTATAAAMLIDRDVIRHQPDLTLVGFALNDVWGGLEALPAFVEGLTAVVRHIRSRTESDIILLTPNFMNAREAADSDSELESLLRAAAALQSGGVLDAYAQAVRDVAARHDLPCADVYRRWEERAAAGEDVEKMLANGLNHPTAEAHAVPAALLMRIVAAADSGAAGPGASGSEPPAMQGA